MRHPSWFPTVRGVRPERTPATSDFLATAFDAQAHFHDVAFGIYHGDTAVQVAQ
jgi:hypothetical protein